MNRYKELVKLTKLHHVPLTHYIETGCRDGELLRQFDKDGWEVRGIEMDPGLALQAAIGLKDHTVIQGDSAKRIWQICSPCPTFFFLDAHWWGGYDECADSDLPLLSELAAIRARPYADFVVIDDIQLFGLSIEKCKERQVDAGWAGVTRMTVQTALGKHRILRKGCEEGTKPQRMWISMVEDKDA
jgi:hypothetical protein